jgi:hypothetical protein
MLDILGLGNFVYQKMLVPIKITNWKLIFFLIFGSWLLDSRHIFNIQQTQRSKVWMWHI